MTTDFTSLSPQALLALDASLREREHDKWQSFYSDRGKPCPFFISDPDECLAGWISSGRIARGRALDIGCGNGRNAIFLARQGWRVDAIDLSASAVAWAREHAAASGVSIDIRCTSVFDAELEPGAYDLVYDGGCFHHIAPHRREQYVQTVAAALAPAGAFGLVCFRPEGGSGFTDEEVYQRHSLGGGLGYTDGQLRAIWSRHLRVSELRQMRDLPPGAGLFGRDFLWVMLACRG